LKSLEVTAATTTEDSPHLPNSSI